MMIASMKDVAATALTAASLVFVWAHLAEWGWPLTATTRITALVALALAAAACATGSADGWEPNPARRRWYQRFGAVLGSMAGVAAVVAILFGWTPALVVFAVAVAVLWLVTTVRHVATRRTPVAA